MHDRQLEEAVLARGADTAAEVLARTLTAVGLTGGTPHEPAKEA
ncbi:hypothetical protein [Streptomyces sp. NPDC127112]